MRVDTGGRDLAVDVARLGALLVVVFGHCALLLATIDDGTVRIGNLLGEVPELRPVTWLVQVMPLFFFAGGAAGAYGYHGTPWGTWLFTRAQRLCRPVFWYLAFWAVVLLAVRATMGPVSESRLGGEAVALLWFLGVYLITLAFVPALVRLDSTRAVLGLLVALLAAAGLVDAVRIVTGGAGWGVPNFLFVWLVPVLIGVGYARALLRPGPAAAIAAAAFAAAVALATTDRYEVALVVTGVEEFSNVSPPSLLLALHATWVSCAFVVVAAPVGRWARRPRVLRPLIAGNRGAMTLYLWHIPVIAATAVLLHLAGQDAYDVDAPGFWGRLALRAAVFAVLMTVAFVALAPLEHRPLPWWDAPAGGGGPASVAAGVLVCVAGITLVVLAKHGLRGAGGWTALGLFVAAAVAARSCRPHSVGSPRD